MPVPGFNQPVESTDPNDVYLLYSSHGHVTGRRLGEYLGVEYGRECNDRRYDYLIRWGTSDGVRYIPSEDTINYQSAITENTDKYNSLQVMQEAGVPLPEFSRRFEPLRDEVGYPLLGRETNHTQGRDIELLLQERDDFLTDNDFYVEYIPTAAEYRVHVADGEVFHTHQKLLRHEADNHPYIRNYETGWVFGSVRNEVDTDPAVDAVEALGLDFGAVDLIRGEDGGVYVLEVNTAPSCDAPNLERYAEQLSQMVGLDSDGLPGMEAVENEYPFEDDEEQEYETP